MTDTTSTAATTSAAPRNEQTAPDGATGVAPDVRALTEARGWEAIVEHAYALGPDPALADLDDAALETNVRVTASEVAAVQSRFLTLVAEVVVRGLWAHQGAKTPADWLSWAVGLAPSTARENVRVALALRSFPLTRARFAEGRISYSKVRAITRVPYLELEDVLLDLAEVAPASHLDRIVAGFVATERARGEDGHARRSLASRWCDDGDLELEVRLPGEVGAYALALMTRMLEHLDATGQPTEPYGDDHSAPVEAGPGVRQPIAARRADALVHLLELAADRLGEDTSGLDRTTLVLHVDAASLRPGEPDDGPDVTVPVTDGQGRLHAMSVRVLRRLACEAGVVMVTTEDGLPIDVGHRHRHLTAALRRALRLRDRHCRFPGCGATAHLHAHHIVWWSDDGPTDLSNLVLLCSTHHRFVHDAGWRIATDGRGRFAFSPPGAGPVPGSEPLPGAPAEARRAPTERYLGPDPRATILQPHGWGGERLDLRAAVDVIVSAVDRLRRPATEMVAA